MSGELDALALAVESLDLPVDTDVLAEVLSLTDRLQAKVARAAGEVDAAQLWELDGATSLTAWLRQFGGMTKAPAASLAKTARRLRSLPVVAASWADGWLSGGQVQVVLAYLSDRTVGRFAEGEASFVPLLFPLDLVETTRVMQEWRRRADAELDDVEADEPDSTFHLSRTLAGRYESTGSFDADGGSVIETALRLATTEDAEGEERTPAERRADAEVVIHQHFLDHQRDHKGGRRRPHVDVVVQVDDDGNVSGRLIDGPLLPMSAVERTLCDCAAHRVLVDSASAILDYGRATRIVPVDLFNALVLRDQGCRHPGCDRPADWCDAHHVIPWWEGGPTSLENLALKCRRHHLLGHRPGWHDKLLPDGT
ncbi:MAG: endonuclease, partial [Actinomycetia bacterium]|nr:endonuclease [Actinomycetes bacterium]